MHLQNRASFEVHDNARLKNLPVHPSSRLKEIKGAKRRFMTRPEAAQPINNHFADTQSWL